MRWSLNVRGQSVDEDRRNDTVTMRDIAHLGLQRPWILWISLCVCRQQGAATRTAGKQTKLLIIISCLGKRGWEQRRRGVEETKRRRGSCTVIASDSPPENTQRASP